MSDLIYRLTKTTTLTGGDTFPIWSVPGSDTMGATLNLVLAWLQENLSFEGLVLSQQYAAPSATGFSVAIMAADTWLILTPVAGYAAGTIIMPEARANGQVIQVNCTQPVTTLTVDGNGTTVTGAPSTLTANGFFTMKYDAVLNAWFRVG